MEPTAFIKVTKLEAARRQLATAIDLWADDRDPVSVHSLAFAAHQIVHDINRQRGGSTLLLDEPSIRADKKHEFINLVKRDANFFKHADNRSKGKKKAETEIEFNPETNELFIALTIAALQYIEQDLTKLEVAFYTWYRINRPDMLTDAGRELFENGIPTQTKLALRAMNKREFLECFLKIGSSKLSAGSSCRNAAR